jgi:hypothetical protein
VSTRVIGSAHLAGLTGSGVAIAVVDSGIHAAHPHIGRIAGGVGIDAEGRLHGDYVDRLGHGTAIAAAIQEKAPGTELHVVRVFDDSLATSARVLAQAIAWAAEHGVRLVNLSLGTANAARGPMLAEAVVAAAEQGTLVVSAARHEGMRWFPGCLPGAIGIELDWACPRDAIRIEGATLHASGYPRPIPGVPTDRNLRGISFAVANATAFLALALERDPTATTAAAVLAVLKGAAGG